MMKNTASARKFVRNLKCIHAQCWAERVLINRSKGGQVPETHYGLTVEQARDIAIEVDRLLR